MVMIKIDMSRLIFKGRGYSAQSADFASLSEHERVFVLVWEIRPPTERARRIDAGGTLPP